MSTTSTNLYPFVTRNQIKARLEADAAFRNQAMSILLALQTEAEQATESTRDRNRQGFMSSHAKHGTAVAKKINAGEPLTVEDMANVDRIAPRYSRQLASFFRAKALVEQPALAAVAARFSADKVVALPSEETEVEISEETDAAAQ